RCRNLYRAQFLKLAKAGDQIAIPAIRIVPVNPFEPVQIKASQVQKIRAGILSARRESHLVGSSCCDPGLQELLEATIEMLVGHLLGQNRRDADRQLGRNTFLPQLAYQVEKWDIGLRHALVEAFLTERPHARLPVVRQMAVKHQY